MDSISLNQFRDKFQGYIDRVLNQHQPLKVTGQSGADFIVISAEDWKPKKPSTSCKTLT